VNDLTALRLQLRTHGYSPLPLEGKIPAPKAWQQKLNTTPEEITLWEKSYHLAGNTGLLTHTTPALDIDILDEEAADAVEALAREHLEERGDILVRVGKWPKRAILLRTDEPFAKITANVIAPDGTAEKIELLASGQQLAIFGQHPETRQDYRWPYSNPARTAREELPYVREAEAQLLVDAAVELLIKEHGYSRAPERPKKTTKGNADRTNFDNNVSEVGNGPDDWAYLIGNIWEGRELHDSLRDLAAKMITAGMAAGAVVNHLRALMQGSNAPHDARWQERFDDIPRLVDSAEQKGPANQKLPPLDCAPWWIEPETIPRREFLYGKHFARKNIGASIGAGGRLKTTYGLFECVEMAVGYNLITKVKLPAGPLHAGFLNAEEDQDELDRRVAAICQRHGITRADLGGRLFVKSVCDRPLRFATLVRNVPTLNAPALEQLADFIQRNQLDIWMLDPWVSFHSVSENTNADMDLVIKQGLKPIASATDSAGEIFHHPGKPKPGAQDTVVEDARGASAIIWAVRSARVFNFMTPEEAKRIGIAEDQRRLHVRVANGKANMGPIGTASWLRIEVENLANGDEIACASPWNPPDPFAGVSTADMHKCRTLVQTGAYRADSRSPDWIGYAVAKTLNINVVPGADNKREDLARIKQILKTWIKNKVLKTETRTDENRQKRAFVLPGPWSDSETSDPDLEEITLQ
jgi:hypothetical protein